MQSFLRRLRKRARVNARTLILSVICVATLLSSGVFTGITAYASRVEIYDDGKLVKTILTNTESADEILQSQGIAVSPEDEVIYKEVDENNAVIKVNRAFDVQIKVDSGSITVAMVEGTVEQALEKSNVYIGEQDVVSEDLSNQVTENMVIKITRVTTDMVAVQEEIPYNTVTKETNQLLKGKTQVQTEGKKGIKTNYYSCVYEDGVEVSRSEEPVCSEINQEPVDEVILVGTLVQKPAKVKTASSSISPGISELAMPGYLTLDENGLPANYTKVISGRGVAYTASAGAKTSTGRTVKPGYVAVNPNVIPYGSELYIVASDGTVYGYAIAADTGGSCMANEILVDLFMSSTSQCYAWGSKTVNIYVLS